MQLSVRDVARLMSVSEDLVYRWVSDEALPAELVNDQYRFNRAQLLEWATLHKLPVSPSLFPAESGEPAPRLDHALEAGWIFYQVPGSDKESVLRALVDLMPPLPGLDKEFLLQVLLSRESLGSTGVGDGLALPHPRYPVVLPLQHPFITLCFLEKPIPYSASGLELVHTLFALVSPTVRVHLGLLARLACALRDPGFRQTVQQRRPSEEILAQARRVEDALASGGVNYSSEGA
jgi:PTS system nitrogen regulatory IIA component